MKLLIDIDDHLFWEVKRLTKAKTKKDAIVIPMKEYLLQQKRKHSTDLVGSDILNLTLSDLKKSRKQWKRF